MGASPCEGEAAEGGEPHGWGESDVEHGCELERTPVATRQAVGVAPCGGLATEYLCIQTGTLLLFAVEPFLIYLGG